jgi:nitroimidazol reductase NimA-like FMN-containing flavoprotein (pyridoxamine 5'-phosphate oxidase superfamily)
VTEEQLEPLDLDLCLMHLRSEPVGRIAVVHDGYPYVLPVNYRLMESGGVTWIALRTRPGNVIERASPNVAFEIDGVDATHRRGWSVLVRGTLLPVDPDAARFRERFDAQPWLHTERDAWLVIEPFSITGRELHQPEQEWAFHIRSYL